jgi:hypothetical protein
MDEMKKCKHVPRNAAGELCAGVAELHRSYNPSLKELKGWFKDWGYVVKRIPECRGTQHRIVLGLPNHGELIAMLEQLGYSATKKPAAKAD